MTSANPAGAGPGVRYGSDSAARDRARSEELGTETKASFKTTEFFAYLAAVVGVLIASLAVGTGDGHQDYFRADQAWMLITALTIGYMVSRGLAKSGSHGPHDT